MSFQGEILLSNNIAKQTKQTKRKAILKELRKHNKFAKKYLKKRSFDYKRAYNDLQKTGAWAEAKALLIEYFSLSNEAFICPVCETELNPYVSTLHHDIYDNKKLFDPKYVSFLHYDCHHAYHQQKGILATGTKRRVKAYFGSRGVSIYVPAIGKLYVRYELIVLLVFLIALMFNWLWM